MFREHANAHWADFRHLQKRRMFDRGGVYLGVSTTVHRPLFHNGEGHIFTHAKPGFGKSSALVVPTLLTYTEGSIVVTDPKALLAIQTRAERERRGSRVVILNPWRAELTDQTGVDLGDTGFNPLMYLQANDLSLHDNARDIATLLCPVEADGKNQFFTDAARSIITGCLMWLVHSSEHEVSLSALHKLVRQGKADWYTLAANMAEAQIPHLAEYAGDLESHLDTTDQWGGVYGNLSNATQIYAAGDPLGDHVSRNEFDLRSLKREDVTLYIVIPPKRIKTYGRWLNLVFAQIAEAIGEPGPSRPVLLIAEEFANLGYMPTIYTSMAAFREMGLKCWLIVQDMKQLERQYTPLGASELINLCDVQQFFGLSDVSLARNIEAYIGVRSDVAAGPDSKQPLVRVQDLVGMRNDEQVILVTGETPPIRALVKPFYTDQKLLDATDPNPYRGEEVRRRAARFRPSFLSRLRVVVASLVASGVVYRMVSTRVLDEPGTGIIVWFGLFMAVLWGWSIVRN